MLAALRPLAGPRYQLAPPASRKAGFPTVAWWQAIRAFAPCSDIRMAFASAPR